MSAPASVVASDTLQASGMSINDLTALGSSPYRLLSCATRIDGAADKDASSSGKREPNEGSRRQHSSRDLVESVQPQLLVSSAPDSVNRSNASLLSIKRNLYCLTYQRPRGPGGQDNANSR
jgi:hypothetical protein